MNSIIIFATAILLALIATPLAKKISNKFDILDKPGYRKLHSSPIPLLGGLAIFIPFLICSVVFLYFYESNFWVILFGFLFVCFGLIDDKGIKVRARIKIWSHLLFSAFFVITTGIEFALFSSQLVNLILTACFITFMTNSFNMLDGMDGLLGGICAIASFFFLILAYKSGQTDLIVLSLIVMGSCLGFLKYNFNPASIFLGEAGSTFLGYIMAVMALKLNVLSLWGVALALHIDRIQYISFLIPLIVLGIPIFDTFFVFLNRYFNRVKLSKPGKDHSHHRIHLWGLSQKNTVMTLYAVQFVLGAIAVIMVNATTLQFFALLAIVATIALFSWFFLRSVEVYDSVI
ncbi:MAG: undecaprenyl/decaprenyl-phosphate alpha-N-acetylglucosaminyl 1-phosphate transferase [Candidatus Margulisbacteria bacterium]|nr:undecaprenyl/decaprenyl-phosphate alpha-N-acetylglucosaminyl 1-phosphate transferase [Candidatus Margulisiibacteriota bacterium]